MRRSATEGRCSPLWNSPGVFPIKLSGGEWLRLFDWLLPQRPADANRGSEPHVLLVSTLSGYVGFIRANVEARDGGGAKGQDRVCLEFQSSK